MTLFLWSLLIEHNCMKRSNQIVGCISGSSSIFSLTNTIIRFTYNLVDSFLRHTNTKTLIHSCLLAYITLLLIKMKDWQCEMPRMTPHLSPIFTSFLPLWTALASYTRTVWFISGKNGYQMYCRIFRRWKTCGTQYYPALLKPLDWCIYRSNHSSIEVMQILLDRSDDYIENLHRLVTSPNQQELDIQKMEAGLTKLPLILRLYLSQCLRVPFCMMTDVMQKEAPQLQPSI